MSKVDLKCVTWKEGKYYVAQCINVDVSSFGKTRKEAEKKLNEALELYFEELKTPKIVKVEKLELINLPFCYA